MGNALLVSTNLLTLNVQIYLKRAFYFGNLFSYILYEISDRLDVRIQALIAGLSNDDDGIYVNIATSF